MAQCLLLDRPARLAYLGLALAAWRAGARPDRGAGGGPAGEPGAGGRVGAPPPCRPSIASIASSGCFGTSKSSAGGRGSARIAPPDSLRFDVAGPFGSGAASAAVVGERPLWAEPPDAIDKLVPNYPLMWAMFGVARLPADGADAARARGGRGHRLAVRRRRPIPSSTCAPRDVRSAGGGGAPGRRADRARRDDARLAPARRSRAAHGAQRAGPARSHLSSPPRRPTLRLISGFLASLSALVARRLPYGFAGGGLPPASRRWRSCRSTTRRPSPR